MDLTLPQQQEIMTMILIFSARVCDVSLGTMRIILVARGYRNTAPVLGFFEVLIWLYAISRALGSVNGIGSALIYATGFAAGNYAGMLLEEKIALGYQAVRIITSRIVTALPLVLRDEGFGVTIIEGTGDKGGVYILFSVVPKRQVKRVLEIVRMFEPDSFITVEDVKKQNIGPPFQREGEGLFNRMFRRKSA